MVRKQYGLEVSVKPLVGYSDQNFYLLDKNGNEYVLKIAESEKTRDDLEAQNAVLAHIARLSGETICSAVCPTPEGRLIAEIKEKSGVFHFVRILNYLNGKDMRVANYPDHLMNDLGVFLGTMTKALETFDHPALHWYSLWDMRHSRDLAEYLPAVDDPHEKELINYFLGQYRDNAVPLFPRLRPGMIHNDANDFNILVSDDETRITGIIDFEDMVHSYIVCELAVACAAKNGTGKIGIPY